MENHTSQPNCLKVEVNTIFCIYGPRRSGKTELIENTFKPRLMTNELTKPLKILELNHTAENGTRVHEQVTRAMIGETKHDFIFLESFEVPEWLHHTAKEYRFKVVEIHIGVGDADNWKGYDIEVTNIADYDRRFLEPSRSFYLLGYGFNTAQKITGLIEDLGGKMLEDENGNIRIKELLDDKKDIVFIMPADNLLDSTNTVDQELIQFVYANSGRFRILRGEDKQIYFSQELDMSMTKLVVDEASEYFFTNRLTVSTKKPEPNSMFKLDAESIKDHVGNSTLNWAEPDDDFINLVPFKTEQYIKLI